MNIDEHLISDLPDPPAASRFVGQLSEKHPAAFAKLCKEPGLLSDVLTLAAFSPLLSTTLLQNPDYFWWLGRKRRESGVRGKEEMLESLARFTMTHSQLDPQVVFARFRRRELLRIYLRDIRRLATIAEITDEISNLADAILESALKLAKREMDNRFGSPQETDDKGRLRPARSCIVALGKLGSRELNYSSDIDLLFLYSNEGMTSGIGTRGAVTNREYFVKVAEFATKLVGQQTGEGAAYRVDLRLRPHGSLGPLAMSVADTVKYHRTEARPWERQVLIRSRGCAGDIELFSDFFSLVEPLVFVTGASVDAALRDVRLSKEKIDRENNSAKGFNVKLGHGGIREIEFLAQALQTAHGGSDPWLRSPHTLISLTRLADRGHVSGPELSELSAAYEFLRRCEHILQMENGIQTHTIPDESEKRELLGRRMTFSAGGDFETELTKSTENVARIFTRVFGSNENEGPAAGYAARPEREIGPVIEGSTTATANPAIDDGNDAVIDRIEAVSPRFARILEANPQLAADLPKPATIASGTDYLPAMLAEVDSPMEFGSSLSALRRCWSRFILSIGIADILETLSIREAKHLQTSLAEASIAAALKIVKHELSARYGYETQELGLSILALGKLGGRGLDYDSDLDLILVYDESKPIMGASPAEFYARAAELLVITLSSMTRDGSLYRVDLRLRPYGSNGLIAMSSESFVSYIRDTAEIWEMLAFVKLRAVGGDFETGHVVEDTARSLIHARAAESNVGDLRSETRSIRLALEKRRSRSRRSGEIDIKYGAGGMLDVYFAMRYLQLACDVPDDLADRSTGHMLDVLLEKRALSPDAHVSLSEGYSFLSELDHYLRLVVGRTTRVPFANETAMATIVERMRFESSAALEDALNLHRLAIRSTFDEIVAH